MNTPCEGACKTNKTIIPLCLLFAINYIYLEVTQESETGSRRRKQSINELETKFS